MQSARIKKNSTEKTYLNSFLRRSNTRNPRNLRHNNNGGTGEIDPVTRTRRWRNSKPMNGNRTFDFISN